MRSLLLIQNNNYISAYRYIYICICTYIYVPIHVCVYKYWYRTQKFNQNADEFHMQAFSQLNK